LQFFLDYPTLDFLYSGDALSANYPMAELEPSVKSWSLPKPDDLTRESIARQRKKASELTDKVGFDLGPPS
jgi:iron(III) transport system substrate-binding protein